MAGYNLLYYSPIFTILIFIHDIGVIYSYYRLICRNFNYVQGIYCLELFRLGESGTGHSRKLFIESEIVLESNRSQGLVFFLYINPLLGLYCLVQALRVSSAKHETPGKLIYNYYLSVFNYIIYIPLHCAVGLERLVYVVRNCRVFQIRKVFDSEISLAFFRASGCERGCFGFFINHIVDIYILVFLCLVVDMSHNQTSHRTDQCIRFPIQVCGFISLSGNYKRRSGFVYQYRVDLVNNCKVMTALNHIMTVESHIVSQVVKSHFIVCAICNIGIVSNSSFLRAESVYNKPDLKPQKSVNLAHPLAVSFCKVIIYGDYMNPLALQSVEIRRHYSHESFTLARLHFSYSALMQNYTAYYLNSVRSHTQNTPRRLPRCGERFG